MEAQSRPAVGIKSFFLAGVLGGVLATVILFLGTSLLGLPFPPLVIFQLLIAPVPGSIQSVVVDTFREYAKYSAFVFSSVIYSFMYGAIAVFLGIILKRDVQSNAVKATLIGTILPTLIGLGLQVQLAGAFSAISSVYGWLLAILLALAANVEYSGAVIRAMSPATPRTVPVPQQPSANRRGFLKLIVLGAIVLGVGAFAVRTGLSILSGQPVVTSSNAVPTNPAPEPIPADVPNIFKDPRLGDLVGSEVTDNRVFYRVDINPIPPQLDLNTWKLSIHGKVNNPLTLNKDSLTRLPTIDQYANLECVSNTINPPGGLISNAKWTGVQLAPLLTQAGVQSEAKYVIFRSADGYTVGIPLERAMLPYAILAYKMNDATLPTEHGFPLRAIVPGLYGMMNAKWITEIELTDQVYSGYWQERGWSNDARIKTISITYYPAPGAEINGPTPIAGVAFAGDRGISKVEVSVDGGNTWNQAVLKTPKSPYSWVLWAYAWNPTSKGANTILARAYDGTGQVQDQSVTQPFPNGATGYQSMQVTVV
jgi:DMSO/TMAO reductase YedYZ molybdopterin-dependent catalytic subunit